MIVLEFASKKKRRTCKKGYSCRNTCINRNYFCKQPLEGQGKSYADWLRKNGRIKDKPTEDKRKERTRGLKKPQTKDKAPEVLRKTLTLQERSQPNKLIESGKDFARLHKFEEALDLAQSYQDKREAFYKDWNKKQAANIQEKVALNLRLLELRDKIETKGVRGKNKLKQEQQEVRDRLQGLENDINKNKYFDRVDELIAQRYYGLTPLGKEQRDRLSQEIATERIKTPGYKEVQASLDRLIENSPVGRAEAEAIFDRQARIIEQDTTKPYQKEIKEDFIAAIQLTGDPPGNLNIFRDGDRASAKNEFRYDLDKKNNVVATSTGTSINVGNEYELGQRDTKEAMLHEYGHGVEFRHQEIAEANNKWLQGRSSSNTPVRLSTLEAGSKYGEDEVAYPDKFSDPYVGKVYEKADFSVTEVFSMGVQHFVSPADMRRLYAKDKEHFYLTLGTIIELQKKNRK